MHKGRSLLIDSAADCFEGPGSMWNSLWRHALKRSPGINRKSMVLYPGLRFRFLCSATRPLMLKKLYNGLIKLIWQKS